MTRRFRFTRSYRMIPLVALLALSVVEYVGIPEVPGKYQNIGATAALLALLTAMVNFDNCTVYSDVLVRTSYFVWKQSIRIADIAAIRFPPTWIASPEARTLVVESRDGRTITMTDMAYSRPVLSDVVRTLVGMNPSIQLDTDVRSLTASG